MKTIKDWNDITLETFLAIHAISKNEKLTDLEKSVLMYSEINNVPVEQLNDMDINEFSKLMDNLKFMNNECPKRMDTEITLNGTEYTIDYDIAHMSVSQYIDFQANISDINEKLPELLSIFIIPRGHNYNDGYDIKKTLNDVMSLPYPLVNGLTGFFFQLFRALTNTLMKEQMNTLKNLLKKEKDREKKNKIRMAMERLQEVGSLPSNQS